MDIDHILQRIKRMLDQASPVGEQSKFDSNILGSASLYFSDEDLVERVNNAQRTIVGRCKAQHVQSCITSYNGTVEDIVDSMVRLLPSRVFRGGVRCVRRSVDTARRLERSGRAGSATYPTYTFEDGLLYIYPDTASYSAYIVAEPTALTISDVGSATVLDLDERFEAAIIYHVVASCFETMQDMDMQKASMELFADEISAFGLNVRYQRIDDMEVDVE